MKRIPLLCLTLTLILLSNGARLAHANTLAQTGHLTLVDRIGGASLAVAVQGDYAFVGQSAEFTVLDMRDHTQPRRIAYLPLATNDIALQAGYAYVTNQAGVTVIDIQDPTHPMPVGFLVTPNALNALAVADGMLYASDPRTGLYLIDISQPQQPTQVGFLSLWQIADMAVQGDFVYLATAAGLQVIDVADSRHPQLRVANDGPGNAEAVVVAGQYAYLTTAQGSLVVIDIADPGRPKALSKLRLPTFTKNLQVNGAIAYIANGNQGIAVVDLHNRQQPRLLGVSKIGTLVTALAVIDGWLFATDVSDGGLHIVDPGDPARLRAVGVYRAPGIALDVAVNDHYAYLATGLEGDITIVDHGAANGLVGRSFYQTPERTTQVTVSADRLYAYGAYQPLQLFDRTNPLQLVALGAIPLGPNAHTLVVQAHLAYVSAQTTADTGDLHILDASPAGLPNEVALVSRLGVIEDLTIVGDVILVAAGSGGLLSVHPAAGLQPALVAVSAVPGYAQRVAATADHAYVLTRSGMLYVVDRNHSALIQIVGQLRLGAKVQTITVQDGVAYLAAGEAGVYVVDLAQPTAPKLRAVYNTPGTALQVAVVADKIFVADSYAGLLVLALASQVASSSTVTGK